MAEKEILVPVKTLDQGEYRWFVFSEEQTGQQLVCLEDKSTGVIVTTPLVSPDQRSAAHKAWAGARQSRAPGTPWEIMHEMGEKGVNPDEKLEEMFTTYGHASVGDMARLQIDFMTPMHWNMALFNQSAINGGQEKSTRYQRGFAGATLHSIENYLPSEIPEAEVKALEERYQNLGDTSLQMFARFRDMLIPVFTDFYKPETASDRGALASRVLDCARYALVLGQSSGMSMETSARDWSRIIGEMKASPIPFYGRTASLVEKILNPTGEEEKALGYLAEAPGLIKHSDPAPTVNQNLARFKEYLGKNLPDKMNIPFFALAEQVEQGAHLIGSDFSSGDLMVAQYLSLIYPGIRYYDAVPWARTQNGEEKRKISDIIFDGHDKYTELPIWTGTTEGTTVIMKSFLGELRDFNRHRGMRRFIPMPLTFGLSWDYQTTAQILDHGFGLPRYVDEINEFKDQKKEMTDLLKGYYDSLNKFFDDTYRRYGRSIDYHFVLNLLPLAHQTDLWMSGDPKQWNYFASQRVRPSGHINYRTLAWDANDQISRSDPYLSGMKLEVPRPDPASRAEFFDRS